jgi:copper(I)-binding protein
MSAFHSIRATLALLISVVSLVSFPALAGVTVTNAWVRSTVAQQKVTGGFMTLTSSSDTYLVGASSPIAESAEVHEMSMENGIMRMRAIPRLQLPAGKPVELKPGGFHIMLFGLKQQVKPGDTIVLTLSFEDGQQQRTELRVNAIAKPSN